MASKRKDLRTGELEPTLRHNARRLYQRFVLDAIAQRGEADGLSQSTLTRVTFIDGL